VTPAVADGFVTIPVDLGFLANPGYSPPSLVLRVAWHGLAAVWRRHGWPCHHVALAVARSSPGNPFSFGYLLFSFYFISICAYCTPAYAAAMPSCCLACYADVLLCMPCSTLSLMVLFLCLLAHCDVLIICVHVYIMCNFLLVLVHMPIVLVVGLG
jgi:hypothetical protein